ncbi:uncharacterized protein LOC121550688 [Coregonus clupeaformis]|uniref:uncharacterized protein LOC121550688 n=1 Tax=Coregonus clupeaformis TaxID=59861 RepID=UPI001E1C91F6|nr:uncharacterized protein LOC121550688 [Coregonus clupeaformis]
MMDSNPNVLGLEDQNRTASSCSSGCRETSQAAVTSGSRVSGEQRPQKPSKQRSQQGFSALQKLSAEERRIVNECLHGVISLEDLSHASDGIIDWVLTVTSEVLLPAISLCKALRSRSSSSTKQDPQRRSPSEGSLLQAPSISTSTPPHSGASPMRPRIIPKMSSFLTGQGDATDRLLGGRPLGSLLGGEVRTDAELEHMASRVVAVVLQGVWTMTSVDTSDPEMRALLSGILKNIPMVLNPAVAADRESSDSQSPLEIVDIGQRINPGFFLSDEHISRICSDTVTSAYSNTRFSVLEDKSLGFTDDRTLSPPSPLCQKSQCCLTAGEETGRSPSLSEQHSITSLQGRQSCSSHCRQTSGQSAASLSGSQSPDELLTPEVKQRIIMAVEEIITEGGEDLASGSTELCEAVSPGSRRFTSTTSLAASNILSVVLHGLKDTIGAVQSKEVARSELEKTISQSLVNSVKVTLKSLLMLDAQVSVVQGDNSTLKTSEQIPHGTMETPELIPAVTMETSELIPDRTMEPPGCSSDIAVDKNHISLQGEEDIAYEASITATSIFSSIVDLVNPMKDRRSTSSRGGSQYQCPMRAFLDSKDLAGFLRSPNLRRFSEQLILHVVRLILESKMAKTMSVRKCFSDMTVTNLSGGFDLFTKFCTELLYSFVEGAVKNLLETFLSVPHSPPVESFMEDYSCMEERNWVASPTLSRARSARLESDDDSTITQESGEVGVVKPSSRKTINGLLSDMFIFRVGELLQEGCDDDEVEQTAARVEERLQEAWDDDEVERISNNDCMMPDMMSETSYKYSLESDVTGCEKKPYSPWMTGELDECRAESVDSAKTEHRTSSFRQSNPSQASFKAEASSGASSLASLETMVNLSSSNNAALTADRQNMAVTQSSTGAAGHKGWRCIPCCQTAEGTPIEVPKTLSKTAKFQNKSQKKSSKPRKGNKFNNSVAPLPVSAAAEKHKKPSFGSRLSAAFARFFCGCCGSKKKIRQ